MCGHLFIGYPGLQSLKQSQPLWRCSACGRQSQMPLDCCASPAYQTPQSASLVVVSLHRLGELLKDMHIRLLLWLQRNPKPRTESGADQVDRFAMAHVLEDGLFVRGEEDAQLPSASAVTHLSSGEVSEIEDILIGRDGLEASPNRVPELLAPMND